MNKLSKVLKNVLLSVGSQIAILAIAVIMPRLVLVSFGSETNGLLSTITQIFVYISLLEAGIGNSALIALYQPIVSDDRYSISEIISATKKHYRKATLIYMLFVLAFSCFYPFCIDTTINYTTIFLVILFQGLSGAVGFFFTAAYRQLLSADGKTYVQSLVTLLTQISVSLVKIVLMLNGFNVITLQIAYFVVNCVQVIIYLFYVKKNYPWLVKVVNPSERCMMQKNDFLVHELSIAVFNSTDLFLIASFQGLAISSVYAIYNMVFSAINALVNSLNGCLSYVLGQTYSGNRENYAKIHDAYNTLSISVVFDINTVAYLLLIPFVTLYTKGVSDINYVDYTLPFLFVSIQLLSCTRAVSSQLINVAGHAKSTKFRSIIESTINLITSVALVDYLGVYGVLLGTIIALLYRMNDMIIYAEKKILRRNVWNTYKIVLLNVFIFIFFLFVEYLLRDVLIATCNSYFRFVLYGILFTIIAFAIYVGGAILANRNIINYLKHILDKSLKKLR